MELINYFLSVNWLLAITISSFQFILEDFDKLINLGFMDVNIVGSYADLAKVQKFSLKALFCSPVDVGRFVDDQWTLPTKFKDAWHKIFGSCLGNQLSFLTGSRKAKQVKSLIV